MGSLLVIQSCRSACAAPSMDLRRTTFLSNMDGVDGDGACDGVVGGEEATDAEGWIKYNSFNKDSYL